MSQQEERLRPHPVGRFAGESHVFDLNGTLGALRAEAHAGQHGHRQMTIFHRTPVTKVLFAFEPGGELTDHATNGLVTIHVLEGQLEVQAAGETHKLESGTMIVLNASVRHSVRAAEAAAMLLTVHLETGK